MSIEQRFINLGWFILESKYCYYCNPKFKHPSDIEYDKIEIEYKNLAKQLKVEPTASDMVGFNVSRPSCKLVKEKVDRIKSVDFILLKDY